MMNETLFRETFSQLHASDEAKKEVLTMMTGKNTKRAFRMGRAVGLAAALTAALAITAGAVNLATEGELFRSFSIIWSDGYEMQLEDEGGNQVTARLLGAELEKVDGRWILRAVGREMDITEALEREGRYHFEDADSGLMIDVEGDPEHWTMTQSLEGGDISYSLTTKSDESDGTPETGMPTDSPAAERDAAALESER